MTQYDRMTKTPIPKLIISLSIPTIISMLISAIYNVADTFFVSKLGDSQSAAISVVFSLQTLIQAIGFTIGMGSGSMISRMLGKQEKDKASVYASSGLFLGFLLGTIFMIVGLCLTPQLMNLLGASTTSKPFAVSYAKWIFIAAPFMMMSFILNNSLRSEGLARLSVFGIGLGGLINIGLDPLCIFTFNMGVSGAGFATMISQIISFSILISFYIFKRAETKIGFRFISKDAKIYLEALKCGSPTLFRQGFSTSSNIILSFLGKNYGDYVVAALGITAKIYLFTRNIVIGMGQAYQPVLGYNYGAHNNERIKKAFYFTMFAQTILCCIATIIVVIFPVQLISFFRDTEEIISVGRYSVRYLAISLPFLGFSTIINQSLQVTGFAKSASFLASLRQGLVYTPVIFIFNSLFGIQGLCLTQPISDLLTAIISIPFLFYFFRILKRNVIKTQDEQYE